VRTNRRVDEYEDNADERRDNYVFHYSPSPLPYGESCARRRGIGSVERRRGCDSFVRRSRLPGGRPRPCTASSRMHVISCESVRCSAAARRRSDSFKWLGTYAPMKTPLRFAIYPPLILVRIYPANTEQVSKPNSVLRSKSKWRSFI